MNNNDFDMIDDNTPGSVQQNPAPIQAQMQQSTQPAPTHHGESILELYGEDLLHKEYITNPAIARDDEINKTILILLTPEKSVMLIGKPGIGKTAIVEGLAYRMQRGEIPNALKPFTVIKLNTTAIAGGDKNLVAARLRDLVDELKYKENIILFIDEIHTLVGSASDGSMDIANMLKPGLDRGSIKMIGATTTEEFERYIIRDKAFLRRFDRVEVEEPDVETTVKIVMGTIPKTEKKTGAKFKYSNWVLENAVRFMTEATSEYKRIYGMGSRYPDVTLATVSKAFSFAVFDNRNEVLIKDFYKALITSTHIYPDVIEKEKVIFKEKFKDIISEEGGLPE